QDRGRGRILCPGDEAQRGAVGLDDPNIAMTLKGLAAVAAAKKNYANAEIFYQKALAIREKALGAEHPETDESLHVLAAFYRQRGRYADSRMYYSRSVNVEMKRLGADDPKLLATIGN